MGAGTRLKVYTVLLALVLMLGSVSLVAVGEALPALEVYLIDPCGGCQGAAGPGCGECELEAVAWQRYRALLEEAGQPERTVRVHNLRRAPGLYDDLDVAVKAQGHDDFRLPLLMIGEAAFPADGSADDLVLDYLKTGRLPEDLDLGGASAEDGGEAPSTGRRVIYLYSAYCEDCRLISPWLEEVLPEAVTLLKYDIGSQEGLQLVWAVEERYQLAEEDFMVPALISGDQSLLGSDQIRAGLAAALADAALTPVEALLDTAD